MKKFLAMVMIAAMSLGIVTSTYALPQQKTQHLKKDGTPDKRYKENKQHLKKDGTPDMRYKENKKKKTK
jgi:hypothetical protein